MKSRFEKSGGYYAMNNTDLLHTRVLQYRYKLRQLEAERDTAIKKAAPPEREKVKAQYQNSINLLEEKYRKYCDVVLDEMKLTIARKKQEIDRAEMIVSAIRNQLPGVMDENNPFYNSGDKLKRAAKKRRITTDEALKDKQLFYEIVAGGFLPARCRDVLHKVVDDFESVL